MGIYSSIAPDCGRSFTTACNSGLSQLALVRAVYNEFLAALGGGRPRYPGDVALLFAYHCSRMNLRGRFHAQTFV